MITDALTALLLDPFLTTGEAEREFGAMRHRWDKKGTISSGNPRKPRMHDRADSSRVKPATQPEQCAGLR